MRIELNIEWPEWWKRFLCLRGRHDWKMVAVTHTRGVRPHAVCRRCDKFWDPFGKPR